jgi:D-sedoheptulose 7-phosphate isomerase
MNKTDFIDKLCVRYPDLDFLKPNIINAVNIMIKCYKNGGVIYTCGNGGSAADANHIVGEIMKGFHLKRALSNNQVEEIANLYPDEALEIAKNLQQSIPAVSLVSNNALLTAISNDGNPDYVFAQQIYGLGKPGDVLLAISTSGNSLNIVNAAKVALARNLSVIVLTGSSGGKLKEHSSLTIQVPSVNVAEIQEYHLPIYHCICAMMENILFYKG